jgi:hypothetical protein
MRLLAGLTAPSPVWEGILNQEGFPWKYLPAHEEWFDLCSVLVVTRTLEGLARERAIRFLQRGGAILGSIHHFSGLGRVASRTAQLRYLIGDGGSLFRPVGLIDLHMKGHIPREANHLRTDANEFAVFAGELIGGVGVLLPFDVQQAMMDTRVASKAFYYRRERLPSERVSLVSRGEIRHLIRSALVWLHHVRGLPYAHLWYYPGRSQSVATLRIDTDGAPREDVDVLYRILQGAGVPGTWFLDVKAHETWLPHFHTLPGQEIALHCYEHRYGKDLKADESNLRHGRQLLAAAGWDVKGFAAPFGIWTPGHSAIIDRMGFAYSSEFSCGYDTLPFFPMLPDLVAATLQVPIHPISIGSLCRVGGTARTMRQYYEETASRLLSRHMPLFFYHHPTHRNWDVVEAMVNTFRSPGVTKMTMLEYARWWQQRALLDVDIEYSNQRITVVNGDLADAAEVYLRIVRMDGQEALASPGQAVTLPLMHCDLPRQVRTPDDLRRIRDVDPRTMLGDLYTSMLRRLK